MNIVFRADASLEIGTGHVMRCLTLAGALREQIGAQCRFICRAHSGHVAKVIQSQGYRVTLLPHSDEVSSVVDSTHVQPPHAAWLTVSCDMDSRQTIASFEDEPVADWLVVDHYALDSSWERSVRGVCKHLMVIDDLADRSHCCDLLLDQGVGANVEGRYDSKVPRSCIRLLGPGYALLRKEFGALRSESLKRRADPRLSRLLIFLGGTDPSGETMKVVRSVKNIARTLTRVDVVVGGGFPYLGKLRSAVAGMPMFVTHVQTSRMAELMCLADVAITAGGTVSWEKCALGLPSLVCVLGDNQVATADSLDRMGAQRTLGRAEHLTAEDYASALCALTPNNLVEMTEAARRVCDGGGANRVVRELIEIS